MKILRPRLAQDPIAVKRFLREAEYGARVKHPNIVQTYDYGATDGLHYLALEWAQGEPLAEFINRSGKLAPPLVATIVEQLGAALAVARTRPGSSTATSSPPTSCTIPPRRPPSCWTSGSRGTSELNPEERLTRAGFFVGTLQYVAPETLSGELVSEQADVYSLATIAYYMLSQELPFTGKSPRELFQQLLTQPPVPLNQAVKGLRFPPAIESAVMRGLERDLSKRSKTVDEFAGELCTAVRQGGAKRGFLSSLFGKGKE